MGGGWGGFVARTAVRKVVYVLVGLALAAFLAAVGVRGAERHDLVGAPVPPSLSVPCTAPDDPPGCDPDETPEPTASPTPTPTATPEPTALVAEWSTADRARVDALTGSVVAGFGLVIFLGTVVAVSVGLRR